MGKKILASEAFAKFDKIHVFICRKLDNFSLFDIISTFTYLFKKLCNYLVLLPSIRYIFQFVLFIPYFYRFFYLHLIFQINYLKLKLKNTHHKKLK